jgi:hypothetical protein
VPRLFSQEQGMIAPVCGGVLRDARIFLPCGVLAWLPTKPRETKIGKTTLALIIGATKKDKVEE